MDFRARFKNVCDNHLIGSSKRERSSHVFPSSKCLDFGRRRQRRRTGDFGPSAHFVLSLQAVPEATEVCEYRMCNFKVAHLPFLGRSEEAFGVPENDSYLQSTATLECVTLELSRRR
jgi:hypothetical protein